MKDTRVTKEWLLNVLRENRTRHRDHFLRAIDAWQDAVIEALTKAREDAIVGRKYKTNFHLPEPEDHTEDYDLVIEMLEASEDGYVTVTRSEFQQYVKDDWNWKAGYHMTTALYGVD